MWVRIFYRNADRDPFTYAGSATAKQVYNSQPVRISWTFEHDNRYHDEFIPEEILDHEVIHEGAKKSVYVNVFERNPHAKAICIDEWGSNLFGLWV